MSGPASPASPQSAQRDRVLALREEDGRAREMRYSDLSESDLRALREEEVASVLEGGLLGASSLVQEGMDFVNSFRKTKDELPPDLLPAAPIIILAAPSPAHPSSAPAAAAVEMPSNAEMGAEVTPGGRGRKGDSRARGRALSANNLFELLDEAAGPASSYGVGTPAMSVGVSSEGVSRGAGSVRRTRRRPAAQETSPRGVGQEDTQRQRAQRKRELKHERNRKLLAQQEFKHAGSFDSLANLYSEPEPGGDSDDESGADKPRMSAIEAAELEARTRERLQQLEGAIGVGRGSGGARAATTTPANAAASPSGVSNEWRGGGGGGGGRGGRRGAFASREEFWVELRAAIKNVSVEEMRTQVEYARETELPAAIEALMTFRCASSGAREALVEVQALLNVVDAAIEASFMHVSASSATAAAAAAATSSSSSGRAGRQDAAREAGGAGVDTPTNGLQGSSKRAGTPRGLGDVHRVFNCVYGDGLVDIYEPAPHRASNSSLVHSIALAGGGGGRCPGGAGGAAKSCRCRGASPNAMCECARSAG